MSIGDNVSIGTGSVVQRGTLSDTVIESGCAIGALVIIGHDSKIRKNCLVVSQAGVSGHVVMAPGYSVYGQAGIADRVHIGTDAVILGKSRVFKNIPAREVVSGDYNMPHRSEMRLRVKLERLARDGKSQDS